MGDCTLDKPKNYSCIICHEPVHRADEDCSCSEYRKEQFQYASVCQLCVKAYDRLMGDEELQPVLKHLLNAKYWEGSGPVIDF